jgi:hypothetical protein
LVFHSGREADHSSPFSAEVNEWVELYLHSPHTASWRGAQGEHRDNFYTVLKHPESVFSLSIKFFLANNKKDQYWNSRRSYLI